MTSKSYLPYLVLALFMLLFFNVFSLAILFPYPFKCFQRLLDFCLSRKRKLALQIYMDSLHGYYEDTMHDYCHFATLYLAVRFFNLLMASVFSYNLYYSAAALLFVFALALIAKFQPYKCKRNNTVDIILLLAMISGYMSSSMHHAGRLQCIQSAERDNCFYICLDLFCAISYFLSWPQVLPKAMQCFKKCKTLLVSKTQISEVNVEDGVLSDCGSADYNTCS